MADAYLGYWGKASREGDSRPRSHRLVYHLLDVASVGAVILDRHPSWLNWISGALQLGTVEARQWVLWLLGHHDIGKFAASFQRLRPELAPGTIPDSYRYDARHDTLGYVLWMEKLLGEGFPNLDDRYDLEDAVLQLLRVTSGHHGKPPESPVWGARWFRNEDIEAARLFSRDLSRLIFDTDSPPNLNPADDAEFKGRVAVASWPLAGLAVLCDWIGSNRRWFPFSDTPVPMRCYWNDSALPNAARAVEEAAVIPAASAQGVGFEALFPDLEDPTDLQAAAEETPIATGPQLILIEDLTGAGKTEASLTLVGRMLEADKGQGLYVALPTTATADAMYGRVWKMYRKFFDPGSSPSLVLAHSRRDLSADFRDSMRSDHVQAEGSYDHDEEGAAATCAAWLGDHRKKALLAQVGVGTIDQALLAVLNVRHQPLRALGTLGKILVIDEVHACDAYMNRVLVRLLHLHAAMGGSAILMSATLPLAARRELVEGFADGAGFAPPQDLSDGYPQLLNVSSAGAADLAVEAPPWARKTLGFEALRSSDEVEDWVAQCAGDGACVCWIRNTVGDAVQAYEALAGRLGPGRVTLFHARFALGHRLDIERDVLDCFGKASGPRQRAGRVVVATQVVEQSLDLDFDEMVTDLAPVDLLIQRAGRLRRHVRDNAGNLLASPVSCDGRGAPVLRVLTPPADPNAKTDWIRSFLPGTAAVYDHHGHLWLTADFIERNRQVALPHDSRRLVESVFGDEVADHVPTGLQRAVIECEGKMRADASLAGWNTITPEIGYGGETGMWTDDEDGRTRLGEPTVTLRLARWDGTRFQPLISRGSDSWSLAEVSVARRRVSAVAPLSDPAEAAAFRDLEKELGAARSWMHLVPLREGEDGMLTCRAIDASERDVWIQYSRTRGLEVAR
jgi:CRISPR-associated endonuclease/helicase Cas3